MLILFLFNYFLLPIFDCIYFCLLLKYYCYMITYIEFFLERKSNWTSSSSLVLLAAPWAPGVFTVPCLMSLSIYFPYFC